MSSQTMRFKVSFLLSLVISLVGVISVAGSSVSKTTGPPAFFLQDPNDGLCLGGADFKRCAIDTLWYVTGKPGSYQLHHRKVDEMDDEFCLDKVNCALSESSTRLGSCNHCGARKWNILGDQDSGYVLSEDNGKHCLTRDNTLGLMHKCEKGFTSLSLQFATVDNIKTMESPGARLVTASADGDIALVKELLEEDLIDINSQDWDKLTAIIGACSGGHYELTKYLIKKGANVNAADKDSITALMETSIRGDVSLAKLLIDSGAEVDATAASGVTSLWLACGEGQSELVKYLLNKGASSSIERMDGITALMAASIGGHLEAAKLVVEYDDGCDINAVDQDGLTAIMNGAENGSVPIVEYLINKGASPSDMSTSGFTPLIIASAGGHLGVVELLLEKGAEVDVMHPEGVNALMYAAAGGHNEVVKLLLKRGADVNALHTNGGSALMEASTSGNITVIQTLLDHGADPFIVDHDGVTPLMSAASQGHVEICQLLLEHDPFLPIDAVASSGGTALMFASGAGHYNTTKFLLSKGANVNMKVAASETYLDKLAEAIANGGGKESEEIEPHQDGVTSLHVAASGGHYEVVELLLTQGQADPNIKDDEELTPLLTAIKGNYNEIALLLIKNNANPNDIFIDDENKPHNLLWDSIVVENYEFAHLLIKKGANLDYLDEHNVTILIQAAHKGQTDLVEGIIERVKTDQDKDKDKNILDYFMAKNDEGITALTAAASEGHDEIVSKLITASLTSLTSAGLTSPTTTLSMIVDAQDNDGTTALMAGAVRGHDKVIEILLKQGKSNVNIQNIDGHTALMFAYNGRNQVASLLDKYSEFVISPSDDEDEETKEEVEAKLIAKKKNEDSTVIIRRALETHTSIVNMLISYGADLTIKDNKGNLAIDFDHVPVVVPDSLEAPTKDETKTEL